MPARLLFAAALFTLLLSLLAGCGPGGGSTSPDTLIYSRGTDADTLDPLDTTLGETVTVLVNLYDTLVTYDDETLEIVPSLAEKWEVSEDKLTWVFHIRPGVKFHDGTVCDAAAIEFNLRRFLDPEPEFLLGVGRPYREAFDRVASVKAVEENRLEITLTEPDVFLLENLAMFPAGVVSPKSIREAKSKADLAVRGIGTGPFKLESWSRDERLVLAANPDHWRGPPGVSRVVFLPVPENAVRAQQIVRGEAHITDNLPPTEIAAIEDKPGVAVQRQVGMNVGYLTTQLEKPPLDQLKVREAIWRSIDKQRRVDTAYSGPGRTAVSIVPPTVPGWDADLVDRTYDPAEAKRLLEEAAAEQGFTLPLKLNLFFMKQPRPYMQQPQQIAVFLRDALAPIGIELTLVLRASQQHFQRLSRGEHDLALAGWSSDNGTADNFLHSLLDEANISDDGGNNVSRWRNSRFHDLLVAARSELDEAKRNELYRQAQQLAFSEAPVIPLVHTNVQIALRDQVEGYKLHPSSLVRLRGAKLSER